MKTSSAKLSRYLACLALLLPQAVRAEDATVSARPAIETSRWEEDWSALSDLALRTQPFDDLKYIPLSEGDPQRYLSLGLNLRERFESNDAPNFGVGNAADAWLLQRLQVHADLHFDHWQAFVQLEDARAFDKRTATPVDRNPLDLRLAFIAYNKPFADGTFKLRAGRQDFLFDLQRFVSSRDGPNVRQSFDAVWAGWEARDWRVVGFVSQPVQYRDDQAFDDFSNRHFRFDTLRVERTVFGHDELSAYYSLYERDNAQYRDGTGAEHRQVLDVRFAGHTGNYDWDLEAMHQGGTIGAERIAAWALGERAGYTLRDQPWQPRLGLQFDAASGDRRLGDGVSGTFNPLFPNGYYFSLAGYTGYANLVQLKPSLTVKPAPKLTLMGAVGGLWRETTADAVYVQPNVPVAGTAGRGSNWTGAYVQGRADYAIDSHAGAAIEVARYQIGAALRQAGGHDSDYLGVEFKYAW